MKDLTGVRFGKLIALHPDGQDERKRYYWRCVCDCGSEVRVKANNLRTGNTESCGCIRFGKSVRDLAGETFGELTVTSRDMCRTDGGKVYWLCECSCGEVVSVWMAHLLNRHSIRCSIKGRHATSESALRGAWARAVKSRYDYTCQKCGSKGDMHAHHILSYTEHLDLRFEVSNGTCLCVPCHKDFHRRYGLKGFTEKDFKEWKGTIV